jgi:hypothetical protein
MNVYAVLIVLGQTVASIGPWPSDLAGCQSNIPASNRDIDAAFDDPTKLTAIRKGYPDLRRDQIEWTCIESATKPVIKDAVRVP